MNCQEIRSLSGPYLDSELDAKTSLEIQDHLATCAACAQVFAAEEKLNAQLTARLRSGEATPDLWKTAEERVRAAAAANSASARPRPARFTPTVESWWRAWLWPSPQFYAGLAAVWAVMLTVHWLDADDAATASRRSLPPSPETERVLVEQRRELAEMLGFVGAVPEASAPKRRSSPPQGRTRQGDVTPGQATGALAAPKLLRV